MTQRNGRRASGGTRTKGSPVQPTSDPAKHKERPIYLGYLRVSTEEQADSGLGLDAQELKLREKADREGWALEILADRGKSGKYVNAGLRDALDQLSAGLADGLIVAKVDRLARSVQHAATIINRAREESWNLVALDLGVDFSTPQGRAMANMLATFAEFERDMISVRTKEALAATKARGTRLGAPRLVSPALARRIVSSHDAGATFGAIARELTAQRILSPAGRPTWQESTVRRIYRAATPNAKETSA